LVYSMFSDNFSHILVAELCIVGSDYIQT